MEAVTFDMAAAAVRARLSESGASHALRVAETAGMLAETYGVDVESARLAGVLHDWDREVGDSGLLGEAERAGVPVSDVDKSVPYLLHARTGAVGLAQALPGVSDDVVHAVARHTVGSTGMTDLDMVVFIADMIEPARHYKGFEELRAAVGVASLHELFASCYQRSVAHLVTSRRPLHPDTVGVWNEFVARGER